MIGVQIAKVHRQAGDKYLLAVDIVAEKCEGGDALTYFSMGSPEQQKMFPYINTGDQPSDVQDYSSVGVVNPSEGVGRSGGQRALLSKGPRA